MSCSVCKQDIGNSAKVTIGTDVLHSACFKCHSCEKSLSGVPYFNIGGNNVCKDCYAKTAPQCHGCHKSIIGTSTTIGGGRNFHPECFVCHKCKKQLTNSFTTNSEGLFEHTPNCDNPEENADATCFDCKKALVNVKYISVGGGNKVCEECYAKNHSAACHVCSKQILEGQSHVVNEWKYHKDCFKCQRPGCGKYLGGRKIVLEANNVNCKDCSE